MCGATSVPGRYGYVCTRERGHDSDHVAERCNGYDAKGWPIVTGEYARWPQETEDVEASLWDA